MVSSISTVEPNSLIILIFEVKLSQRVSLMRVGNINFINSLRMMVIVAREISGLRDKFWLGKRGMLLIYGEARRDAKICHLRRDSLRFGNLRERWAAVRSLMSFSLYSVSEIEEKECFGWST